MTTEELGELYPDRWALLLVALCEPTPHNHGEEECPPNFQGKRPLRRDWNGEAVARWSNGADRSGHLARAASWLGHGGNIGLAVPPGVVVLDADTPEAVAWLDTALPDAPYQESREGRGHFLARVPEALEVKARSRVELADGIAVDVRSAGRSQIASEPSVHVTGAHYTWKRGLPADLAEIPECPPRILEAIRANSEAERAESPPVYDGDGKLRAGDRHPFLKSMAGTLRHRGLGEAALYAALSALNAAKCDPPKPDAEVRRIAEWAAKQSAEAPFLVGGPVDPEEAATWPDKPGELPSALPDTPTLPAEMLPEPLRAALADAADRMAVPLECVAAPAVVGLAAVVGRTVGVAPREHDDWLVVPNLWGGLVGPPGVMKTACIEEGLRPVRRIAAEEWERAKTARASAAPMRAAIEADLAALKRQKPKSRDEFVRKFEALEAELARVDVKTPRLTTSDATVEKLAELLEENPRGLLLTRDELAGWLSSLERDYAKSAREFFLEAWNGDGRFEVDRIERGSRVVEGVCLLVFGGIQPGKLAPLVAGSLRGEGEDDGLLQRFQVVVWPSDFGAYREVDRWPDSDARKRAAAVYRALYELKPEAVNAAPLREGGIPALRLEPTALGLFREWRGELEGWLRSPEAEARAGFAAHLAKYRSLVPALALLFHLAESVGGLASGGVGVRPMQLAASWSEFLFRHATRVYADALGSSGAGALALAARIRAGRVADGTTLRDVAQNRWSRLGSSDEVEAAVASLEGLGWVRREERATGGRPAVVIRLHPNLRRSA